MSIFTHTANCARWAPFATLGASLGATSLLIAPTAAASVELYLQEVRAKVDAPLTDAEAIELGNVACGALNSGVQSGLTFGKARHHADQAVGYASQSLGIGLSMPDGMFLVEVAEDQLC